MWLKGKGDEFFGRKDFKGAVNAYAAALEADAFFLAARSNRAAGLFMRAGQASAWAMGTRMSGVPICARTEPST